MSEFLASLLDAKTLIILLLVVQQTRETLANKDYKESQHETAREGFRKGYQCSQEATRKTIENIAELWRLHNAEMQNGGCQLDSFIDELESELERANTDAERGAGEYRCWDTDDVSDDGDGDGGLSDDDVRHPYGGHADELDAGDGDTGSSKD